MKESTLSRPSPPASRLVATDEPIAVVGLGGIFPQAPDIPAFWNNILQGRDCVIEVPLERWDWRLYYDPDPKAPDKTYSKIGGFIQGFVFNPLEYHIPPQVAPHLDSVQHLAIAATQQALKDSGYDRRPFDAERTAVILGNSLGGPQKDATDQRVYTAFFRQVLSEVPEFVELASEAKIRILTEFEQRAKEHFVTITEDSMPGELSNVIAGRVANTFNLRGPNFTVDAACASSLAALDMAVKGLRLREYDLAVCGGVDQMMSPPAFVKFCKVGALSPDGSRPFDAGANGFVMGEGVGICILKRAGQARADGDRIYALIRSLGASSDGKGKGITAPNPAGQRLAVLNAFRHLDYSPQQVGLVEAHATSTPVGDVAEVGVLKEVFAGAPAGSIGIGSIKSQLGHLKAAAGAASLIKTALALHHKILPPTIHIRNPNPKIDFPNSPFRPILQAQEWEKQILPRRADVSAFGFGGTNFHAALEEDRSNEATRIPDFSLLDRASDPHRGGAEIFLFRGNSLAEIPSQIQELRKEIDALNSQPLSSLSGPWNARSGNPVLLALSAPDALQLSEKLNLAQKILEEPPLTSSGPLWRNKGIHFRRVPAAKPKIAFLFPGQGSQYVDMLRDLREQYPIVAETFAEADRIGLKQTGKKLSEILFTRPDENEAEVSRREWHLKQTEITQPAVLTADIALMRLLKAFGVEPDAVCGHSLGEYAALVAAGCLSFEEALYAVSSRAREMANVQVPDPGKMASVSAPVGQAEEILKTLPGYAICANKNCPAQTVIAGESAAIQTAVRRFNERGITAQEINVSHAFHSAIVAPAQEPYRKVLDKLNLQPPRIPILSNVTADYYPRSPEEIKDLLVEQIAKPVEFTRQIERLYRDGIRVFIEVGPKRALTAFVSNILQGTSDAVPLPSNHPKRGGLAEFHELLARLAVEGVELNFSDGLWDPTVGPDYGRGVPAQHVFGARPTVGESGLRLNPIVISGISIGLPGSTERMFQEDNFDRILKGENRIEKLSEPERKKQLQKNIRRLVKSNAGEASFEKVARLSQTVQLAGRAGSLDLEKEFGIPKELAELMDATSQMALAAGLLALKDAAIPLVSDGAPRAGGSWALPESLRAETGVLFASAFAGYDSLVTEIGKSRRKNYRFPRTFLLKILALGHAQIAQWIKAQGPSLHLNAAFASTSTAIATAEDWIRTGRAKRVLVVAADAATSPALLEWIASGFLAAGAATTVGQVEEAALPFDRRRQGTVLGAGAVALVVEDKEEAEKRGLSPAAQLLAAEHANSAFHLTRMDVAHLARILNRLLEKIQSRCGLARSQVARELLYLSHETFTPAQGGSAEVELEVLRQAFREDFGKILIANTKGFTGHTLGASLEDAIAIRALETGRVPPIANLKFPDPSFQDAAFSRGEPHSRRYALRFSAGFGSQAAYIFFQKLRGEAEPRLNPARYQSWLREVTGLAEPELEVVQNTLRIQAPEAGHPPGRRPSTRSAAARRGAPEAEHPARGEPSAAVPEAPRRVPEEASIRAAVLKIVEEKTGYPIEMLELDADMEADLGIDSVKQAEIFGLIRQTYAIPRQEGLAVKDYPTLRDVIRFVQEKDQAGPQRRVEPALPDRSRVPQGPSPSTSTPTIPTSPSSFKRYLPKWKPQPLTEPGAPSIAAAGKKILLLGPPASAWAVELARQLKRRGATPPKGAGTLAPSGGPAGTRSSAGGAGVPDGLLLADLDPLRCFELLKKHLPSLKPMGQVVFACKHLSAPLQEALLGLAKSLKKERPKLRIKAAAFFGKTDLKASAAQVIEELTSTETPSCLVYRDGVRHAEILVESPLDAPSPIRTWGPDSTFLITGGGQGVVSLLALELSRRYPGTFLILGRTPLPTAPGGTAPGEKARELSKNLERMRQNGATVRYFPCDLSNPSKARPVLARLKKDFPKITALIHGAGIDESQRLEDKTTESFRRVFQTKAAGAELLRHFWGKKGAAELWVFFSSIVGRFGNLGQTDYAAANRYLSATAEELSRRGLPAVSLELTAWSELGMASSGAAKLFLEAAGIDFLPPAIGVERILREMDQNRTEPIVLISGNLGDLDTEGLLPTTSASDKQAAAAAQHWDAKSSHPLSYAVTERSAERVVLAKTFSLESDPYLKDHCIQEVPYVPGVLGLELFACAVRELTGVPPHTLQNVRFQIPIKLLRQRPQAVRILAEKSTASEIRLRIESDFISPQGFKLGSPRIHFTASAPTQKPAAQDLKTEIPPAQHPQEGGGILISPEQIYSAYFHGPSFQVLRQIAIASPEQLLARGIAPDAPLLAGAGTLASSASPAGARSSEKGAGTLPEFLMQPLQTEAAFQTSGYRDLHFEKKMTLPDSIGRILWLSPAPSSEFQVLSKYLGQDEQGKSRYDVWVLGPSGTITIHLSDYRMIPTSQ